MFDPTKSLIPFIVDREDATDSEGFLPEAARQPTDVLLATLLKSGLFGDYVFDPNTPGPSEEVEGNIWLKPGDTILNNGEVRVWNGTAWQAGLAPWSVAGGGGLSSLVGVITLEAHGAKGDTRRLESCTIAGGTAIVSSADYDFVAADIGKAFALPYGVAAGAEPASPTLTGTIAGLSGTDAVLSTNATQTVTEGEFVFGTDDSAALVAAVAAADSAAVASGSGHGGVIRGAPGRGYWLATQAIATQAFDVDITGCQIFMHGLPSTSQLIQNAENIFLIKWSGLTHANALLTGAIPQVLGTHPNQTAKTTLTATLRKGDVIADVGSTTNMKRGDFVVMFSEHDVAWDIGGGFQYHYRAVNRVEEVIDPITVRLKHPVRARAIDTAGGIVRFMTVDVPRDRCVIRGGGSGKVWGNRYDANMANGAGQHFVSFNGTSQALVDGVNFEGVTGYCIHGMFCHQVIAMGCTAEGRDTRVDYVENESSMFGFLMTHYVNEQIAYGCRANRVRHLNDGGGTGRIVAHDCDCKSAATSGYRTHLGNEVMELINSNIEGSGGIGMEAEVFVMRGGRFAGLRTTGLITVASNYSASPTMTVDVDGVVFESADSDDPEDASPLATVLMYFVGDFDLLRVRNSTLRISGGQAGNTKAIHLGGSIAQGQSIRNLDISGNLIELVGSPDGVVGIDVVNGRVFGEIANNQFAAATVSDIIRVREPSADNAGRLTIRNNTETTDGAIVATDLVTWLDDGTNPDTHYDGNFFACDNYSVGPAFPKVGAFAFGPQFDKNPAEAPGLAFASADYIFDGHSVTIRFTFRITSKNGHSGNLSIGKLPALIPKGRDLFMQGLHLTGVNPAVSWDYTRNLIAFMRPSISREYIEFRAMNASTGALEYIDSGDIDDATDFNIAGMLTVPLDPRVRRIAA